MDPNTELQVIRFLDEEGRLKQFPSKKTMRDAVLLYLHEKFEDGRDYTEKEVNAVLTEWSTIGDYFLLRRELVDSGLLGRTPNGGRYWKNKPATESDEGNE